MPEDPQPDGSYRDPDTELLRVARGGELRPPDLGSRPIVLRPSSLNYPEVVINRQGTWARVAGPGQRAPNTIAVPAEGPTHPSSDDPHEYPDEMWRDPSLQGHRAVLVSNRGTQVIPITEPDNLDTVVEPTSPRSPPTRRRAETTVTGSGRRVAYKRRRHQVPYPTQDSGAEVPHTPLSDPDENLAPSEGGPAPTEEEPEVVDVEIEEAGNDTDLPLAPAEGGDPDDDPGSDSDLPLAPEESEEEAEDQDPPVDPDMGGAAAEAPQRTVDQGQSPVASTPKSTPSARGSVAQFLTPASDRSRSRHRETEGHTPEEAPVATTVVSSTVSGHIEIHTFKDGAKAKVFVPSTPIPKVPPKDIGEPKPILQPSTGTATDRSASEGAVAKAPQGWVRKPYKAPPLLLSRGVTVRATHTSLALIQNQY